MQSLKCCNSASRKAREVPKKGKSSEFNPQDYEKVQSSPALTVWSHESVKDCRKTWFWGKNTKFLKIQKKSQDQNRSIFRLQRSKSLQNNWRNFKKSNRLATVKLQKKKVPDIAHFPRPGQNYPYMKSILITFAK